MRDPGLKHLKKDQALLQKMLDVKKEREVNNKALVEHQTTLAELYAQQDQPDDYYEEGKEYHYEEHCEPHQHEAEDAHEPRPPIDVTPIGGSKGKASHPPPPWRTTVEATRALPKSQTTKKIS